MVAHIYNLNPWKDVRKEDCRELEANFGDIVCLRPALAMHRKALYKQQNQVKTKISAHLWHQDMAYCLLFICLRQSLTIWPQMTWNSLCRPGWPWTHNNPPASASWVLEFKVCTTMPCLEWVLLLLAPETWLNKLAIVAKLDMRIKTGKTSLSSLCLFVCLFV